MSSLGRSVVAVFGALGLACAAASSNTRPAAPAGPGAGWTDLLAGGSLAQWTGYRMDTMPSGWQVVDGALTRVAQTRDIITRREFADFELRLDWNIAPCGNSGIMYRVTTQGEYTYYSGPEMQVLDDACHPDGKSRLTAAGSDYGLYPAPEGVVKPAGEWNHVRIVVRGAHVEHWLNGTKVVDYALWSPDWKERVKNSKFAQWPEYGLAKRGHIALQEHGARVAYRNIRIRELP